MPSFYKKDREPPKLLRRREGEEEEGEAVASIQRNSWIID